MYGQPMSPEERAAFQRQLDQERHAKLGQRIRGIRALNRWMPLKEIADRAGVSLAYVEDVLGGKAPPAYVV
jgi:hypothetical protein